MGLLDGKVALITGGGKGIGFGIASAFAEQGAKLFITGRTESRLADAAEKLTGEYGTEVTYTVAEGSDESQVEAALAKCVEHFGKLDVMVNNAQASKSGTEPRRPHKRRLRPRHQRRTLQYVLLHEACLP